MAKLKKKMSVPLDAVLLYDILYTYIRQYQYEVNIMDKSNKNYSLFKQIIVKKLKKLFLFQFILT